MDWRVSFFEARMGTNWHECHAELYKWGVSNAMRRIYLTGTDARLVRPHQWDFPANTHSRLRLHLGRTSRASVPAKRYTKRHLTLLRDAIIWRLYVPLRTARVTHSYLLPTTYDLLLTNMLLCPKNLRSKFCVFPWVLCETFSLFCLFLKNLPGRTGHTFSKTGQKKFWSKTTSLLGEIIRYLKKIVRHTFFRMCRIILPIFRAQNRKKRVEITLYRTISTS